MMVIALKISEIEREISTYTRYRKRLTNNTRWITRVLVVLKKKLRTRKQQLGRYKDRYDRLKREGKI